MFLCERLTVQIIPKETNNSVHPKARIYLWAEIQKYKGYIPGTHVGIKCIQDFQLSPQKYQLKLSRTWDSKSHNKDLGRYLPGTGLLCRIMEALGNTNLYQRNLGCPTSSSQNNPLARIFIRNIQTALISHCHFCLYPPLLIQYLPITNNMLQVCKILWLTWKRVL